jgi:hypothetical protein
MLNMIVKTATPFTSTQHSKPGIETQGPSKYFKLYSSLYNFFTKALIETLRGVINLKQV